MSAFPKKFIHYLPSEQQMKYATCVASCFWLGTQSNKCVRGQRNSEEIGVGATRNHCMEGWPKCLCMNRSIWIRMFTRQSNINFGNLLCESSNWLNHNLLRKTKSTYQKSVDRSIVNLEYSMEQQGNCIEAWTGNGHLKSSS